MIDVTDELVDELNGILRGAEYRTGRTSEEDLAAVLYPKKLKVVQALNDDVEADWKTISSLLARVYFASYDNVAPHDHPNSMKSRRISSLEKYIGDDSWVAVFKSCLGKFEGNLDLKLVLPMAKITKQHGFTSIEMGFGVTYWVDADPYIFRLLSLRGVKFLCKLDRPELPCWDSVQVDNNIDALPADAFIWLSPEIKTLLFRQNGWDTRDLDFTPSWENSRFENLQRLLLGSGNRAAYRWFLDNASDYKNFKKPAVKDVIQTPLLRTYLEDKKDGSVKSKDIIQFVMQTIDGQFKDDTVLLVQKAALNSADANTLKEKLVGVEGADKRAIAQEAIEALESRFGEPISKKTESKMTVPQTVTFVADALDKGDPSKIELLEPVAMKVPMADCVELLERASASCGAETIDLLYEMFEPFEYVSTALLISLYAGNEDAARALVRHGAKLKGALNKVDAKRAPESKKDARLKRYSHGLIGAKYSNGKVIARNLSQALDIYDGMLIGRSEKKEKHAWQQTCVYQRDVKSAVKTLIAISDEKKFDSSITKKFLYNIVCFDGKEHAWWKTSAEGAREIFESGLISRDEIAALPWDKVSDDRLEIIRLGHDYAPSDKFALWWDDKYARPDSCTGKADVDYVIPFVELLNSENCHAQLDVMRALVIAGEFEAFCKCANKDGWLNQSRWRKLLDVATDSEQSEIVAWLVEEGDKRGWASKGLEL